MPKYPGSISWPTNIALHRYTLDAPIVPFSSYCRCCTNSSSSSSIEKAVSSGNSYWISKETPTITTHVVSPTATTSSFYLFLACFTQVFRPTQKRVGRGPGEAADVDIPRKFRHETA